MTASTNRKWKKDNKKESTALLFGPRATPAYTKYGKVWLATAKPKPLSLFISLFQHCQILLSIKIREMKSECGFSLALKL